MGMITKMERPGVRCPICGAKLGEWLNGTAGFWCRKCAQIVTITRQDSPQHEEGSAA